MCSLVTGVFVCDVYMCMYVCAYVRTIVRTYAYICMYMHASYLDTLVNGEHVKEV